MTVMKFRNCKPHYLWLALKRKVGEKELPVGELHLRVQWTSDELERPQEALPSWALDVQLRGVGLSVIEATVLKFPREVSADFTVSCSSAVNLPHQAILLWANHHMKSMYIPKVCLTRKRQDLKRCLLRSSIHRLYCMPFFLDWCHV